MKKIISLCLAFLMVSLLVTALASCEQATAYTQLRDHLKEEGPVPVKAENEPYVTAQAEYDAKEDRVCLFARASTNTTNYGIILYLEDCSGLYEFHYVETDPATESLIQSGKGELKAVSYDGESVISFDQYNGPSSMLEYDARLYATQMMNSLLLDLDILCHDLDLTVDDFGFEVLSAKYRVAESAEAETDMGGFMSAARLAMAGQMVLVGLGMVFLVLAVLWGVLVIFKKVMYDGPEKKAAAKAAQAAAKVAPPVSEPKAQEAPAATSATVPTETEAKEDDAIIAVITAAVAATIASDEALSSQFADGFRVVSFKRRDGAASRKSAWNR